MSDNSNRFQAIANAFPEVLGQVVRKTALDIQANAQSLAPVDTGFLRNSIYTVTSKDSTYGQVEQPAGKDAYLLPQTEAPPDDQTAYVAVGANYGIYLEYGTRYMAPRPYMTPAIEAGEAALESAASGIEGMLEDAAG